MQLISKTTLFIIISRQKFSVCFTEDVSVMCNLSLGIEERAESIGEARGKLIGEKKSSEKIIMNMYNNNQFRICRGICKRQIWKRFICFLL